MDPSLIARLRIHDACFGLSDEDLQTIAEHVEVQERKTGESVYSQGDPIDAIYLVVSGRLKMSLISPGGTQQTIRYVSSGDQFGAMLLATEDDSFPLKVEVDEKAVLIRMPKPVFLELADQFPLLRRNMLKKVGIGIRDSIVKKRKRSFSKIVAFIHADDRARNVVAKVGQRLRDIGENVGILCDSLNPPYDPGVPYKSLRTESGDYVEEQDVRSTVRNWPDLERIILVVDRVHPYSKLLRLVELCDSIYCLADSDDPEPSLNDLRRLFKQTPSWSKKSHLVWVLKEDEQVSPYVPELADLVERDFKVTFSSNGNNRLFKHGVERLVHYMRGINIGLALSGGAARGMAHLGVLQAFEEVGLFIDSMAGTSAGVLTGLTYCAGIEPQFAINAFTKELDPGAFYKALPKGDELYMVAQFRAKTWDAMLRKYVFDWRMEQLPIPLKTVTTDLISAQSIVRETGDGIHALLESINLPVISAPICRDGMLLVDGGVLNNLPTDVLAKSGCNMIIGVNVAAHIENRVGKNTPDLRTEEMKSPGIVSNLLRCLNVQAHGLSEIGAKHADVILDPDVSRFDAAAFSQTPELADVGYNTTMDSVPIIKDYLYDLDPKLFPRS